MAHGGLVSMSVGALDAAGGNVASHGELVLAWNVNGNAAATPVVQGIPFANAQPATLAINTAAEFTAAVNEGTGATSTFTMAHYTGDMAEVMGDYRATGFSTNGTVSLSGLTVGAEYRAQFFHHQDVNGGSQRRMRVIFGTTPSATGYFDAGDETGYVSTVVFTADAATQDFTMSPAVGARAMLNGVVLHRVSLHVEAPVSRQVIQRDASNTADIPVSGTCNGTFSSIEARAVVMSGAGNNGSATEWSIIDETLGGGTFSGTLQDVPAGGWYQIEVRTVAGGTPGPPATVTRIGVGDIYLTCGQSNSANRGLPAYSPGEDRFSALHYGTGAWSLAADPMPGASTPTTEYKGSPWSRFGEMLVDRDNIPVALVCFAEGGSDVTRWLPANNDLYPRLRTAVQRFPVNGFKGILWHQGETNALNANTAAQYQSWLTTVIAQSRVDAGWSAPWYVAEASRINAGLAKEEPVVAGQRATIYGDPRTFAGPVTDNYHQEGMISPDGVHFNAAGLADHAAQWAEVLGGTPPLAPKNAGFESNPALADGGIATIDTAATTSPSVIGWRALNAANTAVADGSCGYYNPSSSFYPDSGDGGPNGGVLPGMAGRHVAYLWNSSANACFLQTRRASLQAGRSYTLTVAIGVRSNAQTFGGAAIELLADGNVLASRSIDRAGLDALNAGNAAGTFTDITLSHATGAVVAAGQALAIRIRKPGGVNTYLDFDHVRLSSVAAPYAAWQIEHFGATGATGIAAASWDADPDGDSLTNAIEYHLGLDPGVRDAPVPVSRLERDGKAWVRYRVPLDPTVDAGTLGLFYSFGLAEWQPAASNPVGTVIESRSANEWALEISSSDHPRAFFQLRAGPPPP